MNKYTHLKLKQEYVDFYDRLTVNFCRKKEKEFEKIKREIGENKNKRIPEEKRKEYLEFLDKFFNLAIYCVIGEQYEEKEKEIKKWMERDQKKDEKFEKAEPPLGIRCLVCGSEIEPNFKDLFGRGKESYLCMIVQKGATEGHFLLAEKNICQNILMKM